MTFLELAEKVLKETLKPMTSGEIWYYAVDKEYDKQLGSTGLTPDYTLSAQLYTAAKNPSRSKFQSIGSRPKRFYLRGITSERFLNQTKIPDEVTDKKLGYAEKDLHPVLANFIGYHYAGYCKTINHSTSRKRKYMQWSHPDMVAVCYPSLEWGNETFDLSKSLGQMEVKILSFEIKLELNFGNLRESFFQAVSNSSWANEGYLVTANIQQDVGFWQELSRLSSSFGIGVIELDVQEVESSDFFSPAANDDILDWPAVNNLATENGDFNEFIKRVQKELTAREVREDWYDKIKSDEELKAFFKNRL